MVDFLYPIIYPVISAFSIILIAVAIEGISDLIFNPGNGVVTSWFLGGKFLSKKIAFTIFLGVTLVISFLNPGEIVTGVANALYGSGGFGAVFDLLGVIIILWTYFNLKAKWDPLSLGGN